MFSKHGPKKGCALLQLYYKTMGHSLEHQFLVHNAYSLYYLILHRFVGTPQYDQKLKVPLNLNCRPTGEQFPKATKTNTLWLHVLIQRRQDTHSPRRWTWRSCTWRSPRWSPPWGWWSHSDPVLACTRWLWGAVGQGTVHSSSTVHTLTSHCTYVEVLIV